MYGTREKLLSSGLDLSTLHRQLTQDGTQEEECAIDDIPTADDLDLRVEGGAEDQHNQCMLLQTDPTLAFGSNV